MTYLVQPKKYAIFVLGAGGTGSWLCAFLDKMSLYNDVIVMDGDVVEAKNITEEEQITFSFDMPVASTETKEENKNGKNIKLLLFSAASAEGINLFHIRQVHILEPFWNEARIEQVIGRAIRFCSHKYFWKTF